MSADSTLPRRKSRLRAMAAGMGAQMATKSLARQHVSDRIGYLLAFGLGAGLLHLFGWTVVLAFGVLYGLSAWLAYRRWRAV